MKWYYADEGQQAGPFDETEIRKLADAGKISADTLVWHTGLSEWQPYSRIINRGLEIKEKTVEAPAAPDERSDRGSTLSESSIKVSEAENDRGIRYAGFWIRFCAKMTDDIILLTLTLTLGYLMEQSGYSVLEFSDVLALIFYLIALAYEVWFLEKFGATPGKTAFKLKVVTSNRGKISYLRASARVFARELSGMIFFIGYIMAAFDSQKRALHDRICDTRVIRKNP